jgi:hypothetical protein
MTDLRPDRGRDMQDAGYGLRRTPLLGCEYPGEWLWATPRTGLTLLLGEPKRCLASDTCRLDTLVSPNSRPGPEARDLIGACTGEVTPHSIVRALLLVGLVAIATGRE